MKLIKFRIQNYKSIIDTDYCSLTSPITILAGKNESGKTTVLEALTDFNLNRKITEDKFPIEKPDVQPSITMKFEISNEEFETSALKKFFKNDFKSPYLVEITKTPPENYDFSEQTKKNLKIFDNFDKEPIIGNLKKELNDF
ncbi:MAG: AAA family ATPase [Mollicutes bacterium]|nr:MAG: AAA family ATPase [Mollicutes bacterium]